MWAASSERIPRYLDRYRGPLSDVALAVTGILGMLFLGPTAEQTGTMLLAALCAVLLLLRRRWPVPVLVAVTAVTVVVIAVGRPRTGCSSSSAC